MPLPPLTKQEAVAELARRGLTSAGKSFAGSGLKSSAQGLPALTKEQAIAELGRRGLDASGQPLRQKGIVEKTADVINSVGAGAAQNIADMGVGAVNFTHLLLAHAPMTASIFKQLPYTKRQVLPLAKHAAYPIAETAGEFLDPVAYALPVVKAGEAVAMGLSEIPALASRAPGFLERIGQRGLTGAATGGLYGGLMSPEAQKTGAKVGALTGAGLSMALGAPGIAIERGLQKLGDRARLPEAQLRTPEEVGKTSAMIGKDVPVNFGDLVRSPTLSSLYHETLTKIPFSGAKEGGEKVLNAARDHAGKIIAGLKHGVDDSEIDKHLLEVVKKNRSIAKGVSDKKFNDTYDLANKSDIHPYAKNLSKVSSRFLKDFSGEGETRVTPEDLQSLNKASKLHGKTMSDEGHPEFSTTTFDLLRNNERIYGEKAHQFAASGDASRAKIYMELKNASSKDLNEAIDNSGHSEIKQKLTEAKDYYGKHVAVYNNPDILKLRYKTVDPDNIHNTLLKGDNLEIVRQMNPAEKDALGYKKFMKSSETEASGKVRISPFKLSSYYDSLSPKQRGRLFKGRDVSKKFDRLRVLTQAAREPALAEARPATGYRNAGQAVKHGLELMAGGAAFVPQYRPELLGGLAAIAGGGRVASKALTSKWLRKAYETGKVPEAIKGTALANAITRIINIGTARAQRPGGGA
jgi:hypothetical protein